MIRPTLSALAAALPTLMGVATAQPLAIDSLVAPTLTAAPALVGAASTGGVFHPASSAEVVATPVNQSRTFQGPTPAGGGYDSNELLEPWSEDLLSKLKCCPDDQRGRRCRIDRYRNKPVGIDPDCLICVKEPYVVTVPVTEQVEAVIYQCFETEVPFEDDGCEDGAWFKKQGKKVIRRLRPCTVTVDVKYDKKVVRYRDVWCHVRCD